MPTYFMEVAIGQFMKQGSIGSFNLIPVMKGISFASIIVCFYMAVYFIVLLAWGMFYFVHSFTLDELPWSTCGNWWNSNSCYTYSQLVEESNSTIISNFSGNLSEGGVLSVAEFWHNYVIRQSSGVEDIGTVSNYGLTGCFLVSWVLCYLCVFKGVRSAGKVVYFTAIFPYIVLIVFVIRGCTLEGAGEGIKYYLIPNITKLGDPSVWFDAGGQVVYSYGLGIAALTTFGSYNAFHTDCYKFVAILTSACSLTSLFAGFSVFGVLGNLAYMTGKNVSDVVDSGPGLAFQTYPAAISLMPLSQLWAILFFLMILTITIDSEFTCVEAVLCAMEDVFPRLFVGKYRREIVAFALCAFMAVLGLPFMFGGGLYYFEIINIYACGGYALFPLVLCELLAFSYIYGINQLFEDIKLMIGYYPHMFVKIALKFIAPLICLIMIVSTSINYKPLTLGSYSYPRYVNVIGWILALSSLIMVPIFLTKYLISAPGATIVEKWRNASRPKYPLHLIEVGYSTSAKLTF